METISGHELSTSVDCKIPLCEEPAEAARGRYARLCRAHRLALQNGDEIAFEPKPSAGDSFEYRVQGLLELARRLDEAQTAYGPVREELVQATRVWASALEELASGGANGQHPPS